MSIIPELPPATSAIRMPAHPSPPGQPGFPLLACVAPVIAAGLIWWITGSVFVLVFAALSPVIAVAGLLDGRRSTARQRRRDAAAYAAAVAEAGDAVDERLRQLRREAWRTAASPHQILASPNHAHRWADPESVAVVLGSGDTPSGLRLDGGQGRPEHTDLLARAVVLARSPIMVDPAGGLGLVGPPLLVRALARSLVVQLAGQFSPQALGVRVPAVAGWEWASQLPHADRGTPGRWLTVAEAGSPLPTGWVSGGIRLALADTGTRLPPGLATIVAVPGAARAEIVRAPGHPAGLVFAPLLIAERQTDGFGAQLAAAAAAAGLETVAAALPDSVTFAAVSAEAGDEPDGPVTPGSLACVIGSGADGPFTVDLAVDGPHALVGGTTGSGKSELLVTWVTSLAARYPPDQVTFLLVDFKGGAAFDTVRELPHCVGLITDLDEREALRALASLTAELRHRERVLRDAGARDVTDPPAAGRLARLVIVVDEFATMLSAFPALHAVFVDIAARGRSLGVHLVLCTQRPAGVVRDALLANCSLRFSLRVNNRADSQAVIGSDAAAQVDAALPGRCIVRRGAATVQPCQVATTTADDVRAVVRCRPVVAPPRRPWLDPLPARVSARNLSRLDPGPRPPGLLLGLLDEPDRQRYRAVGYDPATDGHLLVIGGSGSGKSALLATLAAGSSPPAERVPADVETTWDALVRARQELDRPDVRPGRRLLLLDDVDAVLARWGEEHRAAAIDLLTGLLREGAAAGLHLAVTVQRLSGALQSLSALCQSRLVLRVPNVYEHQAAGEAAAGYDETLPPGGGHWRGRRIQLVQPGPPDGTGRMGPAPDVPSALAAAAPTLIVVAGSPARTIATLRAAGTPGYPHLIDLGAHDGHGPGGRLEISEVGAGTMLVGDVDTWQAHWAVLAGLRQRTPLLFDGCSIADFRAITRRRDLPPPLAPARSRGWLLDSSGAVCRVTVP
ncbi:FtsK/SpoIIIE domain-containing protein [Cryobacterium sp. AP23]